MYCKKCGAEIEDNAVYCPECGVKIRDNEEMPEAPYSCEPEESGINDPLWEPEEANTGNKKLRWFAAGLFGVVFVAAAGILSWKILKPSEPDPTEPTVKIGEAVAEIKNEGSDKKNAQSNEETGKQENVRNKDDVSVALSSDSDTGIPIDGENTVTDEEGLPASETGTSTNGENTSDSDTRELTED